MNELEKTGTLIFANRPLDLDYLITTWKEEKKFGTSFSEIVKKTQK